MVLIVDDDADFLDVACAIFAEASVPVLRATTGAEALGCLEQLAAGPEAGSLACVVLDLRLPDMTAVEVLRRAAARVKGVPVMVLTQALWRVDAAMVREAGAHAIHEKPGKLSVLRALLLEFVDAATGTSSRT